MDFRGSYNPIAPFQSLAVTLCARAQVLISIMLLFSTSGCQLGYMIKSGYNQFDLLLDREPIDEVLQKKKYSQKIRERLALSLEVRSFALDRLGLSPSESYQEYVQLDRPYVTWIVSAAEKAALRRHTWWFPIVGSVPYKGYFNKTDAMELAEELQKDGLDTYVRGVRAYSTLGWFDDPILSSMLDIREHDFVDMIIHEMVHATVYFPDHSEFNEQLAVFFAMKGTQLFYLEKGKREIAESIQKEAQDQILFSQFLGQEIDSLGEWYNENEGFASKDREAQYEKMRSRFETRIKPNMQTSLYHWFGKASLNNARLLAMSTYVNDLDIYQKAFERCKNSLICFLKKVKTLRSSKTPVRELEEWGNKAIRTENTLTPP